MAENDILVPRENAAGGFDERVLTAADIGAVASNDARLTDARTPTSHSHGNLTNAGLVGTTSGLPLKTGTGGIVEAGAFGTAAGQFAEGNHTHTPASLGAAPAVTDIELTPNGTTTITTAQLPARGIAFAPPEESGYTIVLPTPGIQQSGLTFSVKTDYEEGTGTVFITVVHDSVNLLTTYELDEDEGSIDFVWDGYAWTYSNAYRLRSFPNRVLQLPAGSGTIALTSDFAAPPAIGNTTPNTLAGTELALHDGSDTGTFVASGKLTDDRTYDLPDASGTLALTTQLTDTQIFTANGTWTKPAGAKYCDVTVIGGGGGGGAGRRGASGTNRGGGAGGTGAGISRYIVEASQLGATESVVVGAGGAGGTDSADDTDGANGSDGGNSSFWVLTGRLGSGGAGGNSTAVAAGAAAIANRCAIFGTAFARSAGGSGGFDGTFPTTSGDITVQPAGGGGGARIRSTNLTTGSTGANGGRLQIGTTGNEAISLVGDSNGVGYSGLGGIGGGFNPSDFSGVAGNSGGLYGGGGGGGGGALNAVGGSTAGGNGGGGVVVITTYF
jgi:hypothetical protein